MAGLHSPDSVPGAPACAALFCAAAAPTANATSTPPTRQPQRNSPPAAFEPTPNDALYAPFSSLPPPVIPHPAMIPTSVPVRESVASASPIPLSNTGSRAGTTRIASPLTPPDHGVVGAVSAMMVPDGSGAAPADEWRKLLASARSSFDNERRVWEQERQLYQQDIARLRVALEAKQQELLVMATKLKQAELALGDPKSYHSHIFSPPTNGTTRVSPVKSPPGAPVPGSFCSPSMQSVSAHQGSLQSPPAGIPGLQPSATRFSVTHHGSEGVAGSIPGLSHMKFEEDPPSPVSTAAHLSPPPESYRRHAGHTPGKMGSFSADMTPGEKTPKAHEFVPAPPPDDQASIVSEESEDQDPEMQEPLFLPARPDKPEGFAMLDVLQEKLAVISEHPEEQRPAVLQGVSPSDTSGSEVDAVDNSASLPVDAAGKEEGPAPPEREVPGIRLKTKRSYNFGAPIGEMPRRRDADFDDF